MKKINKYLIMLIFCTLLLTGCESNSTKFDENIYWMEYVERLSNTLEIELPQKTPEYCVDKSLPRALHILVKINLTNKEADVFYTNIRTIENWHYLETDNYITVAAIIDFFDEIPIQSINDCYYCVYDKYQKEYLLPEDIANCRISMGIYDISNQDVYLFDLST